MKVNNRLICQKENANSSKNRCVRKQLLHSVSPDHLNCWRWGGGGGGGGSRKFRKGWPGHLTALF